MEHMAGNFEFLLEPEQARQIIETAPVDQGPEEDIQFLYDLFPGNKYFKHWREHDGCTPGEICPGNQV
jgi:hypothetical protein